MGNLSHFDVGQLMTRYGVTQFVETGTGLGGSCLHATRFPFKGVYTIECDRPTVAAARRKLAGTPAIVFEGYTVDVLRDVMMVLAPEPTLWWLDAHFPGSDITGSITVGQSGPELLPLEREVRAIARSRNVANDVLLIDDLRLYERQPFQHGNMPQDWPTPGIGFIEEAFGSTHEIRRDLSDEGYVICTPRGGSNGQGVSSHS